MCIRGYPGLAFGRALALRNLEQEKKPASLPCLPDDRLVADPLTDYRSKRTARPRWSARSCASRWWQRFSRTRSPSTFRLRWSRTSALSSTGPTRASCWAFPTGIGSKLTDVCSTRPSYALSLLSELYAVRSGPLWKDPDLTAFLRQAIAKAAPLLDHRSNEDVQAGEALFSEGPFPAGHAPNGVIRAAFISGADPSTPLSPRLSTPG